MLRRIVYIEGSSLPHFERGDGGPMTRAEAVAMLSRRQMVEIAQAAVGPLRDFVDGELFFREGVSAAVTSVAHRVMGNERPLSDDDHEYYDFCDYLYQQIASKIHYCLSEFISSGGMRG